MSNYRYVDHYGGYAICIDPPPAEDRGPIQVRVSVCAAMCTRWFRKISEDIYDGLCCECFREQFEGEEDMVL